MRLHDLPPLAQFRTPARKNADPAVMIRPVFVIAPVDVTKDDSSATCSGISTGTFGADP